MKNQSGAQKAILIVDDDPNILEVLDARLSASGFAVFKAGGPVEALSILEKKSVDLMISDMKMPEMGGIDLLIQIRSTLPDLPVIFLTAYGTIPDAVRAVKAGAVEYLTKPFDGRQLISMINDIFKKCPCPETESGETVFESKSPSMQAVYSIVERVAASNVSVLILGESGTGKEHIARMIHDTGPRNKQPFLVVDCGSTPSGILESELFGHVKGAFTHAVRDKKGLIEAADNGTLFLDEVGNISPEMQARLLRFLEDRKIRKVGDIKEIPVDCRVLAATNADLPEDIREGKFREDLYYRLRVVSIKVPPLRERKEDIPVLARHFTESFCKTGGMPLVRLPAKTVEWLCGYSWPGNVRELKNALEAGIVLCRNDTLTINDLQLSGLPEIDHTPPPQKTTFSLEDSERDTIVRALYQAGGIQKEAADLLGISRRAIHYKIKKYGIESSEIRLKAKKQNGK